MNFLNKNRIFLQENQLVCLAILDVYCIYLSKKVSKNLRISYSSNFSINRMLKSSYQPQWTYTVNKISQNNKENIRKLDIEICSDIYNIHEHATR